MNNLFSIVHRTLTWIANITGLTYEEVNIVVYFYFLPALFLYLLSKRTNNTLPLKLFTIVCLFSLFIIPDFEKFSNRLFALSVKFLNLFSIVGLDYVGASVVVCVALPALIILYLRFKKITQPSD